jgi:hypothetical protein
MGSTLSKGANTVDIVEQIRVWVVRARSIQSLILFEFCFFCPEGEFTLFCAMYAICFFSMLNDSCTMKRVRWS